MAHMEQVAGRLVDGCVPEIFQRVEHHFGEVRTQVLALESNMHMLQNPQIDVRPSLEAFWLSEAPKLKESIMNEIWQKIVPGIEGQLLQELQATCNASMQDPTVFQGQLESLNTALNTRMDNLLGNFKGLAGQVQQLAQVLSAMGPELKAFRVNMVKGQLTRDVELDNQIKAQQQKLDQCMEKMQRDSLQMFQAGQASLEQVQKMVAGLQSFLATHSSSNQASQEQGAKVAQSLAEQVARVESKVESVSHTVVHEAHEPNMMRY